MNNLNFGWFKGDTVNLGVGQGYLSATPLQLAYYSMILANYGILKIYPLLMTIKKRKNKKLILKILMIRTGVNFIQA